MPRLVLVLALVVSSTLLADITVLVDFGRDSAQAKDKAGRIWNRDNGRPSLRGRELKASDDSASGIMLRWSNPPEVTNKVGLVGPNRNGAKTATDEAAERGYPEFATSDSLYGCTKLFGDRKVEAATLELGNLLADKSYDIRLYASRMVGGKGDCRETVYRIGDQQATLDPANNTGKVVSFTGVKPDAKGRIRIDIAPGKGNTNSYGFYYLGAMEITAPAASPSPVQGKGKNILFFGNSFTMGAGGTPYIVAEIAGLAGHPVPNVDMATSGGKTLEWHLVNSVKDIANPRDFAAGDGFQWDFVVMQEYSTRPTTHPKTGNIAAFLRDAPKLYEAVAKHSPNVIPVLQETWSRSPKHSFFPKIFKEPAEMQAQLRENYGKAKAAVDKAAGKPIARIAPVGDAWELTGWDNLHGRDEYHGNNRGYFLAALVMYATIYEDATVSDIDLTQLAANLGIKAEDLPELTTAAEKALKAQRER
jgi:hypothetical protein